MRTRARRLCSASMSPSARSSAANWPCIQSSGTRRSPWVRCSNRAPISLACSSCVVLRKSGVWQASHRRLRFARSRVRRTISSSTESWRSVTSSCASSERLRPWIGGGAPSERIRLCSDEKSSSGLRHSAPCTAGKTWPSTAATISGSTSAASPVTPKAPSRRKRPARPAIWPISCEWRLRVRRPSNLRRPAKATWSTSMLRPMPMASVATRKSTSPDWKSPTWALRVRGESEPITTAAPPRCRRISSAMA